jgi:hypothetical protein
MPEKNEIPYYLRIVNRNVLKTDKNLPLLQQAILLHDIHFPFFQEKIYNFVEKATTYFVKEDQRQADFEIRKRKINNSKLNFRKYKIVVKNNKSEVYPCVNDLDVITSKRNADKKTKNKKIFENTAFTLTVTIDHDRQSIFVKMDENSKLNFAMLKTFFLSFLKDVGIVYTSNELRKAKEKSDESFN